MYWVVFALFYTVETFTDIFVSWMPFYYEVKILVVLWLALPYTEGSKSLYRRLIHPQLINQEGQIDKLLSYTIEFAVNIVRKAWSLVVNHASTGITTAAMRVTRQQDISANEQPMVVRETHLQQEEDGFVQVSVEDQLS
jgi:receptor expression-enhancing protein 1/2/3/4